MTTSVSGTGGITFPDSTTQNTGAFNGGLAFRNRLINGAMDFAQRGTSFTTPATGTYTLDRWFVNWAGAAPASVAQVAGPTGFRKALQITGAASNTAVGVLQRVESYNCSDLSGATITIQANIAVSAAQTVLWTLYYPTAQDNYASSTLISSGTWSATTTATTFTATITGLPSGATNGLQLAIYPNNAGAFTSGTITITGVQLEKSPTATAFDYRPYGTELALCQRYYFRNTADQAFSIFGFGVAYSTTQANIYSALPVSMRAIPTISGSTVRIYSGTLAFTVTGFDSSLSTKNVGSLGVTVASGLTAGQGYYFQANNNTSGYVDYSAEL